MTSLLELTPGTLLVFDEDKNPRMLAIYDELPHWYQRILDGQVCLLLKTEYFDLNLSGKMKNGTFLAYHVLVGDTVAELNPTLFKEISV